MPPVDLPWSRDELERALNPWIRVLSEETRIQLYRSDSDVVVGHRLRITVSTDDDIVDERVFDAIELLALVGGLSPALFFSCVHEASSYSVFVEELERAGAVPIKCLLQIRHDDVFPNVISAWCERIVLGGIEGTASTEYANIRAMLESAYKTMDAVSAREALFVRVDVHVIDGDFEERMGQLAHAATLQHSRDTMDTGYLRWKPILRITEIPPAFPDSISAKAFLYLTQIARSGIDLDFLWIYDMGIEASTAALFTRGLQLIIGTPTRDQGTRESATKELFVPAYMAGRSVAAVFSALMMSPSLEEVTINNPPPSWEEPRRVMTREERNHVWKWIALALFSRYASHHLLAIRMYVNNLDAQDVAACRAALNKPEAALGITEDAKDRKAHFLKKITASRFVMNEPDLSIPSGFESSIELEPQDVLVVQEESDQESNWVRVLLPGCGTAWVDKRNIIIMPSDIGHGRSAVGSPTLTLLDMNDQSKLAVLELLQAINGRVKSLGMMTCHGPDPMDDWLLQAVRACPDLETLCVSNSLRISSMDVITKMYDDQTTNLRHIRLMNTLIEETDSISRFLSALGNHNHRVCTQLHSFSLTLQHVGHRLVDIVPIIDALLCSNVVLQKLNVTISYLPHIPAEDHDAVSALCTKHSGVPVAVRARSLDLSQKLAFCSVVASEAHTPDHVTSDLRRLDSHILSLIFQFAASCKTREVSLSFETERAEEEEDDDDEGDELADDEVEE